MSNPTPFTETNALLAVASGNAQETMNLLNSMTRTELLKLKENLENLDMTIDVVLREDNYEKLE